MKLEHITIRTDRFDDELAFMQDIAGLQVMREIKDEHIHIIFLSNREGEPCIELIDDSEADFSGNPYLSVGFLTEDAESLRSELIQMDYSVSAMESPSPTVRFFFVKDPAGVKIQFIQNS